MYLVTILKALTTATAQTWTTFNSMQLIEEVSHGAHTVPLKNMFWNSDIGIRNSYHIPAKFYGDMKFFAIKRWVVHVIQQPMPNSHNSRIPKWLKILFIC